MLEHESIVKWSKYLFFFIPKEKKNCFFNPNRKKKKYLTKLSSVN